MVHSEFPEQPTVLRIFISYRREDSARYAGDLYRLLTERFPESQIFWDIGAIEPGVDFVDEIERAVGSCDVLIAVIGRHWLDIVNSDARRRLDNPSDFVRLEIATALERDIRVIPALVQGAAMPGTDVLPESLRKLARRNAFELSDSRWDYDIDQLLAALRRIPAQPLVPPSGKRAPSDPATVEHVASDREPPTGASAPVPIYSRSQSDARRPDGAHTDREPATAPRMDVGLRPTGAAPLDTSPSRDASRREEHPIAHQRRGLGLRGAVALPLGVVALLRPELGSLLPVIQLSLAYVFLAGIAAIVLAVRSRGARRWPFVIEAFAGIAAAAFMIANRDPYSVELRQQFGGWAIIVGIAQVAEALQIRRFIRNESLLIVCGVASLVFGIGLVGFLSVGLYILVAGYAIVVGVAGLGLAFRLNE